MYFGVKRWGGAPLKNCKNAKLELVHLSYVKSNIKTIVREAVSAYPGSLVKPTRSVTVVFAVFLAEAVLMILSHDGFFPFSILVFAKWWSIVKFVLVL